MKYKIQNHLQEIIYNEDLSFNQQVKQIEKFLKQFDDKRTNRLIYSTTASSFVKNIINSEMRRSEDHWVSENLKTLCETLGEILEEEIKEIHFKKYVRFELPPVKILKEEVKRKKCIWERVNEMLNKGGF